jgi:molybdopterin-guanine dinucleotide biosynthesis protein A
MRLIAEIESTDISPLVLSANELQSYESFGKPVIADLRPQRGPLGGIEATLIYYSTQIRPQGVLFLPCDLPDISANEIIRLRETFRNNDARIIVAEAAGRQHHLCTIVKPDILSDVRRALDENRLEIKQLWRELGAVSVSFSNAKPFCNINSPEDYRAWRKDKP